MNDYAILLDQARDMWHRSPSGLYTNMETGERTVWEKIGHLFDKSVTPLPQGTVIVANVHIDGEDYPQVSLVLGKMAIWELVKGSRIRQVIPHYGDRIHRGWQLYDGTDVPEVHLGDQIVKNWWTEAEDVMNILSNSAVAALRDSAVKTMESRRRR